MSYNIFQKKYPLSTLTWTFVETSGYGELYTRNVLSDKEKELIAVSSLVSQGKTGLPLKAHIHGMLNVGWKKNEIIELLIFLTGYVGLPTTVEAFKTLQEILASDQ